MSVVNGLNPLRICHPEYFNSETQGQPYSVIVEGIVSTAVQENVIRINWKAPLVQECITTIEIITGCKEKNLLFKAFQESRMLVQVALYAHCVHLADPVIKKVRQIYSVSRGFDLGKPLYEAYRALVNLFVKSTNRLSQANPEFYKTTQLDSIVLAQVLDHRIPCDYIGSIMHLSAEDKKVDSDKIWSAYSLIVKA